MDGLAAAPGEPVLTKTAHNAFTTTEPAADPDRARASGTWSSAASAPSSAARRRPGSPPTSATASRSSPTPPRPPRSRTGTSRPGGAWPRSWPTRARCTTADIITRTEYALAGRFATIAHRGRPGGGGRRVGQATAAALTMTRVVFLLVPGVHLLDLAGPAQVFHTARRARAPLRAALRGGAGRGRHRAGPAGPGRARTGRSWSPATWSSCPAGDGYTRGRGTLLSPAAAAALAAHHARGGTVASVCAGADALGQAGLLDGRRCTTHHDLQDDLARRYPRRVRRPRRPVRGGRPGGHVGRHRQRHRPGAAPGRHRARPRRRGPGGPRDGRLRPPQRQRAAGQRHAPAPRRTSATPCTARRT